MPIIRDHNFDNHPYNQAQGFAFSKSRRHRRWRRRDDEDDQNDCVCDGDDDDCVDDDTAILSWVCYRRTAVPIIEFGWQKGAGLICRPTKP